MLKKPLRSFLKINGKKGDNDESAIGNNEGRSAIRAGTPGQPGADSSNGEAGFAVDGRTRAKVAHLRPLSSV
jgi:hypothetical protein